VIFIDFYPFGAVECFLLVSISNNW
jgi:hypothetical protein